MVGCRARVQPLSSDSSWNCVSSKRKICGQVDIVGSYLTAYLMLYGLMPPSSVSFGLVLPRVSKRTSFSSSNINEWNSPACVLFVEDFLFYLGCSILFMFFTCTRNSKSSSDMT
jgi:hypothetical protein